MDKIDKDIWLILKTYYNSSVGVIKNDNIENKFQITSGVKQGGILSPYLFNFYIDELLEKCEKSGYGAKVGNHRINNISYCDDLILISPIGKQLQQLINICQEYGQEWKINFNPNKSIYMKFGNEKVGTIKQELKLNNEIIPETTQFKYLGLMINNKLDFNQTIIENFDKVRKAVFSLTAFGMKPNGLTPHTKAFLYKTYCRTKGTFGIEAITLNEKTINNLDVMQNNLLRISIGLYSRCKISSILKALYLDKIKDLYLKQKIKFIRRLKQNELTNIILIHLIENEKTIQQKTTTYVKDLRMIAQNMKCNIAECVNDEKRRNELLKTLDKNKEEDGITDSIRYCFYNFTNKRHKDLIYLLTKAF
jgi:hypothetical protein